MSKLLVTLIGFLLSNIVFTFIAIFSFIVNVTKIIIKRDNIIENLTEYLFVLAIAEDQRGGSYMYKTEDYTVSSTTYEKATKGNKYAYWFSILIDGIFKLFLGQKNHCKTCYENEVLELHNGGAKKYKKKISTD